MPLSADDILEEVATPGNQTHVEVPIYTNGRRHGERLAEHAELERALERKVQVATFDDAVVHGEILELAQQIEAHEAATLAEAKVFVVRNIGRRAWADLRADHPPTPAQLTESPNAAVNGETWEPAMLAATLVSPPMTAEQVAVLNEHLDDGQWEKLRDAAMIANLGGGSNPKSVLAGRILRVSEQSATTAAPAGSPDQSSSVA